MNPPVTHHAVDPTFMTAAANVLGSIRFAIWQNIQGYLCNMLSLPRTLEI
jgi:hypothetical protein